MPPIPLLLVTGFLGAGKTTLMRRLIMDAKARGRRVAVVVNEWGAADVDGHILRQADAELLTAIAGGCACCSGQDELRDALLELALRPAELRPDAVLLETSGLADPVLLLDVLTAPELVDRVSVERLVCVADAARWNELAALGPLLRRQLALADNILLNKADLTAPAVLSSIQTKIHILNERATLTPCVQCNVPIAELWGEATPGPVIPCPSSVETTAQAAHPHAHSTVVPVPHPIERSALEAALGSLPPQVWRAKGFIRLRGVAGLQLLQYTGGGATAGRWHLAPFHTEAQGTFAFGADDPQPAIVFIGAYLDEAALRRDFGSGRLLPMI